MKLDRLSALQLGELVNRKIVSPTEVIEYFKNQIDSKDKKLNAFTYTKYEDAMEEAKKLEVRLAKGGYCGPFAGVPVALKDFLPSKVGWQNSHGGVRHLVRIDDADSMFYDSARKLGAIAIGKTNAPAFGFSGACQNEMYGATKNPFDLDRTSGGSSGGSAAAVAGGLVLLAEGGDAGGSIRIPSAWCNLYGFKSSIGTVPSYCRPDAWAATHPYCFNGCLAKTVEDSAAILNQMARYDPRDPISLPINSNKDFVALSKQPIKGKRIALTADFDLYPSVDSEIKYKVLDAARKLELAGAKVDFVRFKFKHTLDAIMFCWAWSISVDTALDLAAWESEGLDLVKDYPEELPKEFIYYNEVASEATIWDMRTFNEIRTDILDNFENVFMNYDAIISPTTICDPLPLEWNGKCKEVNGEELNSMTSFIGFGETPLANFVGYPAASIPAGFSSSGLPIGMQIIGRKYRDEDVFAISRTFEEICPWNYDSIVV